VKTLRGNEMMVLLKLLRRRVPRSKRGEFSRKCWNRTRWRLGWRERTTWTTTQMLDAGWQRSMDGSTSNIWRWGR